MSRLDELWAAPRGRHLGWLLGCCRTWLTGEAESTSSAEAVDWPARARFCYFHDLDSLLHHLALSGRPDLDTRAPRAVRSRWEAAYYQNYIFNTQLLDLVEKLLAAGLEAGVELRVFKGPVTVGRGWLDLALRVMADVDLLCRLQDLPRLTEIARELGFEVGEQTAVHHLALRHRTLPGSLELHFRAYEVIGDPVVFEQRLWRPASSVEVDGRRLPALAPETAAVLDVAHLLHHDLQLGLRPVLDLSATLMRQERHFDPVRFYRLLDETDLAHEYRCVAALVTQTLGLPLPEALARDLPSPSQPLAEAFVWRLTNPDELHRLGAFEGPHRRDGALGTGAYVLARLFPPLEQLKAQRGVDSTTAALLGYPRHIAATLGRAAARRRAGAERDAERPDAAEALGRASLKRALFARRRGRRHRS